MTPVLFLAAGLCLILLLLLLAYRFPAPAGQVPGGSRAEETSGPLNFGLPSRLLGETICSRQDLEFVATEAPGLQQQFLQERNAVMFLWLRDVRNRIVQVMRFYRGVIRTSGSVEPLVEIKLAANYAAFLLVWEIARGLVWIQNPVAARHVISRVFGAAEQLSLAMGPLLTALDPSLLAKMQPESQAHSQKV